MQELTKETLLNARPAQRRVAIPELGGYVWVRTPSGLERDAFELERYQRLRDGKPPNVRATLVALTVVTETGQKVFSPDEAEALGETRADVLERIFEAAQSASGLTEQDLADLGNA